MSGSCRMQAPSRAIGIVLLGCSFTPGFASEIYRCHATDGTVVFSDQPCGEDAQRVPVDAAPQGEGAEPGLAGTREVAERYWARRAAEREKRLEAARAEHERQLEALRQAPRPPEVVVIQERVSPWPYSPHPYWHPRHPGTPPQHDRCSGIPGCGAYKPVRRPPVDPKRPMPSDSADSKVPAPPRSVGALPPGPAPAP